MKPNIFCRWVMEASIDVGNFV